MCDTHTPTYKFYVLGKMLCYIIPSIEPFYIFFFLFSENLVENETVNNIVGVFFVKAFEKVSHYHLWNPTENQRSMSS